MFFSFARTFKGIKQAFNSPNPQVLRPFSLISSLLTPLPFTGFEDARHAIASLQNSFLALYSKGISDPCADDAYRSAKSK